MLGISTRPVFQYSGISPVPTSSANIIKIFGFFVITGVGVLLDKSDDSADDLFNGVVDGTGSGSTASLLLDVLGIIVGLLDGLLIVALGVIVGVYVGSMLGSVDSTAACKDSGVVAAIVMFLVNTNGKPVRQATGTSPYFSPGNFMDIALQRWSEQGAVERLQKF